MNNAIVVVLFWECEFIWIGGYCKKMTDIWWLVWTEEAIESNLKEVCCKILFYPMKWNV